VLKTCPLVCKRLFEVFPIHNGFKNVLLPQLFHFALKHAIWEDQKQENGLKFTSKHQLVVYADVNISSKT
jgi:hypothetical protein